MKKVCSILMVFTLLFALTACSSTKNQGSSSAQQSSIPDSVPAEETDNQTDSSESVESESKSLGVYFSWSGNTENVAKSIQNQTGADMFEILPQTPYSDDYDTLLNFVQEEQQENARPAISESIENLAQYDVIYVGFPIWWGDMPMILYTFFDSYDLSGKTIAPFCTSGGSGLSGTVEEIKNLEPNATVTDGLHIGSGSAADPDHTVSEWLNQIGFAK